MKRRQPDSHPSFWFSQGQNYLPLTPLPEVLFAYSLFLNHKGFPLVGSLSPVYRLYRARVGSETA
jgi:hypothetical protein